MTLNEPPEKFSTSPSETKTSSPRLILDGYLRRREAARELQVSERTMSRWEAQNIGPPAIRVGKTILYRIESLQAWLRSRESA